MIPDGLFPARVWHVCGVHRSLKRGRLPLSNKDVENTEEGQDDEDKADPFYISFHSFKEVYPSEEAKFQGALQ